MTKANDLASLLDANGDVVSSALDNVPPSNDASALSTGTLPDGRFPAVLPAVSGANLTGIPTPTLTSLGIDNHDQLAVDASGYVTANSLDVNDRVAVNSSSNQFLGYDNGGTNLLSRIIASTGVNDFVSNGTVKRMFVGDTGGDVTVGTANSSLTPNNSFVHLQHGGEISMGAGSSPSKDFVLTTAGSVGIGKTAYGSISTDGFWVENGSWVHMSGTGTPVYVNRNGTDGTLLSLYKSGSEVGSIKTSGGNLIVQGNPLTGKTGIKFGGAEWIPQDNDANSDGGVDLGGSSYRFKDIYLSGSISDGTNSKTVSDIVSGGSSGLTSQQVFTSNGTWTKPAGITKVKVYVVGGGGGAQNSGSNQSASGGSGGLSIALIDVSGISNASITIGAGGSGSSSSGSRGSNGGTSSFGSYASATGGEGGVSTLSPYDGGEGGIGTTSVTSPVLSALNTKGNGGQRNGYLNVQLSGAGSFFGGGGAGAHDTNSTATQGQAGTHGGGAGTSQYSVAIPGGSGLIVIEEYA